jgi:hypothetical protein
MINLAENLLSALLLMLVTADVLKKGSGYCPSGVWLKENNPGANNCESGDMESENGRRWRVRLRLRTRGRLRASPKCSSHRLLPCLRYGSGRLGYGLLFYRQVKDTEYESREIESEVDAHRLQKVIKLRNIE